MDRVQAVFNTTLWRLRKAVERPALHAGELIAGWHHGSVNLLLRTAQRAMDVEEFQLSWCRHWPSRSSV